MLQWQAEITHYKITYQNISLAFKRPQNLRPLERPQISSNDPNFVGCGISLILDDGAYRMKHILPLFQ